MAEEETKPIRWRFRAGSQRDWEGGKLQRGQDARDTAWGLWYNPPASRGRNWSGPIRDRAPGAALKGKRPVVERRNHSILVGVCLGVLTVWLLGGCASKEERAVDLYLDAVMLGELGQDKLAIEKLQGVIELNERFTLAYSELGRAYQAVGDLDGAAAVLEKATELDPKSFPDQLDLAKVYQEQGRFALAGAAYARAGELKPDDLSVQLEAARCFLKAERPAKAMSHCEAARELDKTSREAAVLLAHIHEGQKAYGKAAEVYRQMLAIEAENADLMQGLGLAYVKNGEFELARDAFTSLVKVRPDGVALRNLAFSFLNLGNPDEAIKTYDKALALDAEDWEAHRGMGVAYMVKAGQTDDEQFKAVAVQHWREALAINPDQPKRQTLEKLIREHSEPVDPLGGTQ